MDGTLTEDQSGPGSNGNKGYSTLSKARASLLDAF